MPRQFAAPFGRYNIGIPPNSRLVQESFWMEDTCRV